MKHTTAEMIGRADPVYAMTLELLDQIENVTAELHRERSAQDESFRDFKEASDNARIEAEIRLNYAREEIEQLRAERDAMRDYAERGRNIVMFENYGGNIRRWAIEPFPAAPETTPHTT